MESQPSTAPPVAPNRLTEKDCILSIRLNTILLPVMLGATVALWHVGYRSCGATLLFSPLTQIFMQSLQLRSLRRGQPGQVMMSVRAQAITMFVTMLITSVLVPVLIVVGLLPHLISPVNLAQFVSALYLLALGALLLGAGWWEHFRLKAKQREVTVLPVAVSSAQSATVEGASETTGRRWWTQSPLREEILENRRGGDRRDI